jgi:hypothetical protein
MQSNEILTVSIMDPNIKILTLADQVSHIVTVTIRHNATQFIKNQLK